MTKSALGFTLIELMVVITIIGTLVVVLLPQLARFNNDQMLKNAAADLKSNIRKTQNNASSGLNCNTKDAAKEWKITFDSSINNKFYTIAATCVNGNVGIGTTQPLPSDIVISEINGQNCSESIVFNNISSAISFTGTCLISSNDPMTITLEDSKTQTTSDVIIGRGGAVN